MLLHRTNIMVFVFIYVRDHEESTYGMTLSSVLFESAIGTNVVGDKQSWSNAQQRWNQPPRSVTVAAEQFLYSFDILTLFLQHDCQYFFAKNEKQFAAPNVMIRDVSDFVANTQRKALRLTQ